MCCEMIITSSQTYPSPHILILLAIFNLFCLETFYNSTNQNILLKQEEKYAQYLTPRDRLKELREHHSRFLNSSILMKI